MKKAITIILALVMLCSMFTLVGCKEKVSITAENYKAIMAEKGYKIGDATSQFAEIDEITRVYIAAKDDGSYQIEFYELTTPEAATGMFNGNKNIFEQSAGSASAKSSMSAANYNSYKLTTGGKYKVLSRIDNTLIYIDASAEYKDEIKTVLDEIGY